MSGIQIRNVTKIFGPKPKQALEKVYEGWDKSRLQNEAGHVLGLNRINLDIEPGKTTVVMGLSGSGKSTLIRHLNRLIEPTAGEILLDGQDIMKLRPGELREMRRNRFSMVFQGFALMPHLNILDNAAYGLTIRGSNKKKRLEEAARWLERVGLAGYEASFPGQLSGGMQQRVGLARALATGADILLMDEAFSALDPLIRKDMQTLLIELQAELQKTIVFITHDLDEALFLGDKIAILRDGNLVQTGTSNEILLEPADDYVDEFVRDVNRARVVTLRSIMTSATRLKPGDTPDDVIRETRRLFYKFAYIVDDDDRLLGIVSAEEAERAKKRGLSDLAGLMRPINRVRDNIFIVDALGEVLHSPAPLPVVDEEEKLVGIISPRTIIRAIMRE